MSTTPTPVPAPVKESGIQKFESFFTKFGKILRGIENATVNIAEQQEVNIDQIIPPAQAQNLHILIAAAAAQVAAADAKYDQLGKTDVPYAVKVAEAVAVSGGTFLVVAAKLGFAIPQAQLGTFFGAAGQIAGSLNLTNITQTPTVPTA
jgi:uncharacterized protein YjaG (DUF416 family)